ncbi:uncharacterized protein IWZ02DRAFT_454890 [Phyllosticta citriasiana]|uniref:uncharacterized protein n=1 Tax=Phyllosticta citriasiana TaxID=595635 RepID=UPI0030FD4032
MLPSWWIVVPLFLCSRFRTMMGADRGRQNGFKRGAKRAGGIFDGVSTGGGEGMHLTGSSAASSTHDVRRNDVWRGGRTAGGQRGHVDG